MAGVSFSVGSRQLDNASFVGGKLLYNTTQYRKSCERCTRWEACGGRACQRVGLHLSRGRWGRFAGSKLTGEGKVRVAGMTKISPVLTI